MQGSGTFAIESVISSAIPRDGKLLVLVNGAYGRRIAQMARVHGIETITLDIAENSQDYARSGRRGACGFGRRDACSGDLLRDDYGHFNPVEEIGAVVERAGAVYMVDAMSSFGGIPVDLAAARIDFLISSANKCVEGVPGFGFVLARRMRLLEAKGHSRTLSLDLHAQWEGFERDGQFRFTPPTHVLLAFDQALMELERRAALPEARRAMGRMTRR